jgi:mRNA interferase RelE/StbE
VYEVYLERSAENDLKRLPTSAFDRIVHQIKTLAENPRPSLIRKKAKRLQFKRSRLPYGE